MQTITFAPLAAKTYGDADFAINATATSSLPVSFTASGTPASIKMAVVCGTFTSPEAGSAIITAHQAGDAAHDPAADVAQGLSIAQATLTITASTDSQTYGGPAPTSPAI